MNLTIELRIEKTNTRIDTVVFIPGVIWDSLLSFNEVQVIKICVEFIFHGELLENFWMW